MRGGVLFFVAFLSWWCAPGCTRLNPDNHLQPGETCSSAQVCTRGSYQLCTLNSVCRYVASDGSSFVCGSCNACSLAQLSVVSWCEGGNLSTGGNGGTNGGGTIGGGTTGGGTTGGGTTGGGTTGGGTTGGGTTGGTTCQTCIDNAINFVCTTQADACFNDFACNQLATCQSQCTTDACQRTCFDQSTASAAALYNAAIDCGCNECNATCGSLCTDRVRSGNSTGSTGGTTSGGTTSGGTTSGGTTSGTNTCDSCQMEALVSGGACNSKYSACISDPKCNTLISCFQGCGADATCRMNCYNTAGTAASSKFNDIAVCICSTCFNECSDRCSGMP